jgi:membrane protein
MSLLSIQPRPSAPPLVPRSAVLQPEPPQLPPPGNDGLFSQVKALARYLSQTEVHTYAFSVAANSILSLFPFIVMMFTLARTVFHSHAMEEVIGDEIRYFLPAGQDFVVKNMSIVAHAKSGVQIASLIMLLVSSTGVFLPLEVALNQVWGVKKNRSYIKNQLISLGLAFAIGTLILISVAFTASQHAVLNVLFFGNTQNVVFQFIAHWLLQISAAISSVLMFFIIYWVLPNCKLPVRAVLPTAIVTGLVWELAKMIYISVLPLLDFRAVYGPF